MRVAYFDTRKGVSWVREVDNEQFFANMSEAAKLGMIDMNGSAIACLEADPSQLPTRITLSATDKQEIIAGLSAGITMAGGDVFQEVARSKDEFGPLSAAIKRSLCLVLSK